MPRERRIEYAGAIHHAMARGNRRGDIVLDDRDRRRFVETLKEVVESSGWVRGNPDNLKEEQLQLRAEICKEHAQIARGLSIREFLADMWNYQHREDAADHLQSVLSWCSRSRLKPFVKFGRTLRRHLDGILGYYKNYTTSAAIEAINGLLQLARRRARGYRSFRNFQAIAYWIAGGLSIQPHSSATH